MFINRWRHTSFRIRFFRQFFHSHFVEAREIACTLRHFAKKRNQMTARPLNSSNFLCSPSSFLFKLKFSFTFIWFYSVSFADQLRVQSIIRQIEQRNYNEISEKWTENEENNSTDIVRTRHTGFSFDQIVSSQCQFLDDFSHCIFIDIVVNSPCKCRGEEQKLWVDSFKSIKWIKVKSKKEKKNYSKKYS